MRNAKVQELIDLLHNAKERTVREGSALQCTIPYLEYIKAYFERVQTAKEEGKYVAGYTVFCPVEIFYAMDIVPLFIEGYLLYHNFFTDLGDYLELAAQFGFPPEICSAHRVTDAMVLADGFPRPDFFVFSSQACDNTPKSGEGMAELYDTPCYFLDRPYEYNEQSVNYYAEELKGLIEFLEDHTRRKMDYDRLKEVLELSYKVNQMHVQISEMRKSIPEPVPSEGIFAAMAVGWLLGGTQEAVEYYELLYNEVRERVAQRIAVVPDEKYRIMFPFIIPFWDTSLMDWMEQEHGAVVVIDMLNVWLEDGKWLVDPDNPLENLSRKTFIHPGVCLLHGPMDVWLDNVVKAARDYHADGAIFFSHIGCRQACGGIRAVKDILQEKFSIPLAVIDCDIVDKSFTSTEEVKEKLDSFFEILAEKKGIPAS